MMSRAGSHNSSDFRTYRTLIPTSANRRIGIRVSTIDAWREKQMTGPSPIWSPPTTWRRSPRILSIASHRLWAHTTCSRRCRCSKNGRCRSRPKPLASHSPKAENTATHSQARYQRPKSSTRGVGKRGRPDTRSSSAANGIVSSASGTITTLPRSTPPTVTALRPMVESRNELSLMRALLHSLPTRSVVSQRSPSDALVRNPTTQGGVSGDGGL